MRKGNLTDMVFKKLRYLTVLGLAGLIAALSATLSPVYAQDAYGIQVAVADRSDEEQQSAYVIAMRSVLLLNSGDKTLLNRDDVRSGLRQAEVYVESVRFNTPEPGTIITSNTPLTDKVRNTGQATQLMLIQFDRELINQLIRPDSAAQPQAEADAELDPFSRVSSALLWLIVEDGNQQTLISPAGGPNVMERAREIAGGSGISLSFPAGDQQDENALSVDDIKSAAVGNVSSAASRYAQPLTLAAHLSRTRTGAWEGVWLKVANGQQLNEVFTSSSLDEALQQGIAWLDAGSQSSVSAPAAPQFQSSLSSNSSFAEGLIWVGPLPTTQSYARVMQFMASLDGVDVAYPKEVIRGGAVFAILPRSAVPTVANAANTLSWLRQSATPSAANESRFADGISAALEYLR